MTQDITKTYRDAAHMSQEASGTERAENRDINHQSTTEQSMNHFLKCHLKAHKRTIHESPDYYTPIHKRMVHEPLTQLLPTNPQESSP